jgi:hypothetical protein
MFEQAAASLIVCYVCLWRGASNLFSGSGKICLQHVELLHRLNALYNFIEVKKAVITIP